MLLQSLFRELHETVQDVPFQIKINKVNEKWIVTIMKGNQTLKNLQAESFINAIELSHDWLKQAGNTLQENEEITKKYSTPYKVISNSKRDSNGNPKIINSFKSKPEAKRFIKDNDLDATVEVIY